MSSSNAQAPLTLETARVDLDRIPGAPGSLLWRKVKVHAYIGETILLVCAMSVLNLAFVPSRPGFVGVEPNPLWAVVLLMATRYGFRAGLFSALLCAAAYMALLATRISDNIIAPGDLMAWQYARPAVLFIIVGVVAGMLVQRHKDRIARLERETDALARKNLVLKQDEEQLRDVNVELANRVVGATDEIGAYVAERPVYPADLLGTFYLLAGIDATAQLPHPLGFEAHVLDTEKEGMKSAGMLEEIM